MHWKLRHTWASSISSRWLQANELFDNLMSETIYVVLGYESLSSVFGFRISVPALLNAYAWRRYLGLVVRFKLLLLQ